MPRTYSKTGCNKCLQRRTKCTEEKPICSACARLNFVCVYGPRAPRQSATKTVAFTSYDLLQLTYHSISTECCQDEHEYKLLKDIPVLITAFYSPTSEDRIRDLQIMWQLMNTNQLLRHAGLACFALLTQTGPSFARLHQRTYGKALQTLQTKVTQTNMNPENVISMIAAVVFLGKMESFGPYAFADPLEHWIGLINLLGSEEALLFIEHSYIPFSEAVLMYESLLYHVATQGMFSQAVERAAKLWRAKQIFLHLCTLNPEGELRMSRSALLCGQYHLYEMAFQLTQLLFQDEGAFVPASDLDKLRAAVLARQDRLDTEFKGSKVGTSVLAKRDAELMIYHMFCNSLLLCIAALREPSDSQDSEMWERSQKGLDMFLALPRYGDEELLVRHANHYMLAAIWPIQIQACVLYDMADYVRFETHWKVLRDYLDPGHKRRAQILIDQVGILLNACKKNGKKICDPELCERTQRALPAGLKLLRRAIPIR